MEISKFSKTQSQCPFIAYHKFLEIINAISKFNKAWFQCNKGIPTTGCEDPLWLYSEARHQEDVGWLVLRSSVFTPWKAQVLILEEAESIPEPVWTRMSTEKSPSLRHQGSNTSLPALNQTPCHFSYLVHLLISSVLLTYCNI